MNRFIALAISLIVAPCGLAATSIKAAGMGETSTALPQDSLSVFRNPSQAVELPNRGDLGITWRQTKKKLVISNRETFPGATPQEGLFHPETDNAYFPEAGVNLWIGCDMAVGLAWNNVQDISTRYRTQLTDFSGIGDNAPLGTNARLDYRLDELTGTIAYCLNDCHSVGVGINAYNSRFRVNGLQDMAAYSLFPDRLSDQGSDQAWGVGITFGWTGHFYDCLTLGASYSPKVRMQSFDRYEGLLARPRISIPTTWRVGAAYQATCNLTLGIDGEFRNYSKVRSLNNPFISDSTTGFGPLFGEKHGPGFGWRDQWILRLGAEWAIAPCIDLRAGYRHESPLLSERDTRAALNVLTLETVQDSLSLGGTWHITGGSELSVFGEVGLKHTSKSRYPSNFTGATVNFLSGDLRFTSHNARIGLSYGICF